MDVQLIYAAKGREAKVPAGYTKLDTELTKGSKDKHVYLCYKKSCTGRQITGLKVLSSNDKKVTPPTGYTLLKDKLTKNDKTNLHVAYTKEDSLPPITDIMVLITGSSFIYPQDSWVRIDQNCNLTADGRYVYVCFRRHKDV